MKAIKLITATIALAVTTGCASPNIEHGLNTGVYNNIRLTLNPAHVTSKYTQCRKWRRFNATHEFCDCFSKHPAAMNGSRYYVLQWRKAVAEAPHLVPALEQRYSSVKHLAASCGYPDVKAKG